MTEERQKVLVVGRQEGKTDMIREFVEAGGRVISVADLEQHHGLSVDRIFFEELARFTPSPGSMWPVLRDPEEQEPDHRWDAYPYLIGAQARGGCPKIGRPGAKRLAARRKRNKIAAESRRRNR